MRVYALQVNQFASQVSEYNNNLLLTSIGFKMTRWRVEIHRRKKGCSWARGLWVQRVCPIGRTVRIIPDARRCSSSTNWSAWGSGVCCSRRFAATRVRRDACSSTRLMWGSLRFESARSCRNFPPRIYLRSRCVEPRDSQWICLRAVKATRSLSARAWRISNQCIPRQLCTRESLRVTRLGSRSLHRRRLPRTFSYSA